MTGKRIIIDASYGDDITVVLANQNGEIEELRHQNITHKLIQGNIYLGKIEKIEPSLQAAFVNYGVGRLGFLKFSEIHPKYYDSNFGEKKSAPDEARLEQQLDGDNPQSIKRIHKHLTSAGNGRNLPIHELIKIDQTVLVQVEKDERGTKSASLTTFLSLSGKYCVLLLNSTKANIVSKTIGDDSERKRLREIANDLSKIQSNISIVLKPNAANKTKLEITRDFGYVMRLWDNIQKHINSPTVPLFIHEEGDIIKKSLRELYDDEVDEIVVSGDEAYKSAISFMKMFTPKYVKKVNHYRRSNPIFIEYNVYDQIKVLYSDTVPLASGGYLVISHAEALTAIDVNSGKSKGDSSIEETALRINFEAAAEMVKQIKLRNIAGLIVVDFIDMQSQEAREKIEKIIKEGLNTQNSKALVSKMSEFALIEISRQRIGNSLYESIFHKCRECNGRGKVRSFELTSIAILRAICEEIALSPGEEGFIVDVGAKKDVIMDIINNRKMELCDIERKYNIKINLKVDRGASLDTFFIEKRYMRSSRFNSNALTTIDDTHYIETGYKRVKNALFNKTSIKLEPAVKLDNETSILKRILKKVFRI